MTLRHASIQKLWGEYALTPGGALRETVVTMPDIEDENAEVQFCPPHRVRHELQTLLDLYKVNATLIYFSNPEQIVSNVLCEASYEKAWRTIDSVRSSCHSGMAACSVSRNSPL